MATQRNLILSLLAASLALNLWLTLSPTEKAPVNPRPGKDCSVEMKSIFDGSWSPVIFVHGYVDNYSVARHIVEQAEKAEEASGGRPKGSFRVKAH
jgi:hypothetical protein